MLTQIYNGEYNYRTFLCNIRKEIICELDYKDIEYKPFFNGYNELTFSIDYYNNGSIFIKDDRFDLVKGLYLILLHIYEGDTIIKSEYFSITSPNDNFDDNKTTKTLNCMASHFVVFNRKRLRSYSQSSILIYDSVGSGGILNYILTQLLLDTWSIGTISASLNSVYHSFDITDNSLTDVFKKIEHDFNCILVFDNVNNTISAYKKDEFTNNSGLYLCGDNFIDKISYSPKYDQIITRLYVYGKTNDDTKQKTNIARYNITGQLYIDKFDHFIDNGYFSSGLVTAWSVYEGVATGLQGGYTAALSALEIYEAQLVVLQGELFALQTQLKSKEDQMDAIKKVNHRNDATYGIYFAEAQAIQSQITTKESEITTKEGQIATEEGNLTAISNTLLYSNNFTTDQLEELVNFIYEDTLTIDTVEDAELLYNYAVEYIDEKSQPIYELSLNIADILSDYESFTVRDKLVLGDYAYVDFPTIGFNNLELQLVSYTHNKTYNKLMLQFSNSSKIESDLYYLNDILTKTNQLNIEVDNKKESYEAFSKERNDIIFDGDDINSNNNKIVAGNNYINRRGFQSEDIGGDGQIQVLDDRIIFSKDSWETFYTMLSANGLYLESYGALVETDTTMIDLCNPSTIGYVFAGYSNTTYISDTDEYNPNTWTSKTDIVSPARSYTSSSAINSKGYVYGGSDSSSLQDTDEYNPDTWTSKTDIPLPARSSLGAIAIGSSGYILGGYNSPSYLQDTDEYTPDTWSNKTDMPSPGRESRCCTNMNSKGYVFGGNSGVGVGIADNDEYTPDTWASKTSKSSSIRFSTSLTLNSKAYTFGGAANPAGAVRDTDEYVVDTWTSKTDMPLPEREALACSEINNKGYLYAGNTNTLTCADTDEYVSDTWISKSDMPSPTRRGHAASSI